MKKIFLIFIGCMLIFLDGCKKDPKLPTVTTGEATVLMETHVMAVQGVVTDDGGATVFERGICCLMGTGEPTVDDLHKTAGSGKRCLHL